MKDKEFDWTDGVVAIRDANRRPHGTGFIVSQEGLIATCAHVLDRVGWRSGRDETIDVYLKGAGRGSTARVIESCYRPSLEDDFALLQLTEPLPAYARPLPLMAADGVDYHSLYFWGYRDPDGTRGDGVALGIVLRNKRQQLQLKSTEVTYGYSGGPVWDRSWRRVIAMVQSGQVDKTRVGHDLTFNSFALPVEAMIRICQGKLQIDPPERTYPTAADTELIIEEIRNAASKTQAEELKEYVRQAVDDRRQEMLSALLAATRKDSALPYRYLDFFTMADTNNFMGRETARDELAEKVMNNRLTLVHGTSGVGKTSLLRAGLEPDLLTDNQLPVYVFRPGEVTGAIKRALFPYAPYPTLLDSLSLQTCVKWASTSLRRNEDLVIMVDQFENFFIEDTPRERFMQELAECIDDRSLAVRFVISLRIDYLGFMAEFKDHIPTVLANDYLVRPLTRAEAESAITRPSERYGVRWDLSSVVKLIDFLDKGEISTPHLQLICSTLYEQANDTGATVISFGDELNVKSIMFDFLRDEMLALSPEKRELGWRVLKRLVSSRGMKRPVPLDDLHHDIEDREQLDLVVDRLANRRVLRQSEIENVVTIEIAHDALAEVIADTETDLEKKAKIASEILKDGLANWRRSERLIDAEEVRRLNEHRAALLSTRSKIDVSEVELALRSAIASEDDPGWWFDLATEVGLDLALALIEISQSELFRERRQACLLMACLEKPPVSVLKASLSDPYPQVRAAAIRALEGIDPLGSWRTELVFECHVAASGRSLQDQEEAESNDRAANSFYVAKHPVTFQEYARFKKDIGESFEIPEGQDDMPLVSVTWEEARAYAAWSDMRLPTEGEWETGAGLDPEMVGAQSRPSYPWGDEFEVQKCNTLESGRLKLTPVGLFSPNGDSPSGIADMAGNVWEWCSNLFKPRPDRKVKDDSDVIQNNRRFPSYIPTHDSLHPGCKDIFDLELLRLLIRQFRSTELRLNALNLGIRYDDLYGQTMAAKAASLLLEIRIQERLEEMLEAIGRARPDLRIMHGESSNATDAWSLEWLFLLLKHNFDDDELLDLCFDYLPDYEFASRLDASSRIVELVAHCVEFDLLGLLLEEVRALRPRLVKRKIGGDKQNKITGLLVETIARSLTLEQLKELCFALGVDPENLLGGTREQLSMGLVSFMSRRSSLDLLIAECADYVTMHAISEETYRSMVEAIRGLNAESVDEHLIWDEIIAAPDESALEALAERRPPFEDSRALSALRKIIAQSYNLDEIRELCRAVGVSFETLSGPTKKGKSRALIAQCLSEGTILDLIGCIFSQRPRRFSQRPVEMLERMLFALVVPTELASLIAEQLTITQLQDLAFYLGLESNLMPDQTKAELAKAIVGGAVARNVLPDLVQHLSDDQGSFLSYERELTDLMTQWTVSPEVFRMVYDWLGEQPAGRGERVVLRGGSYKDSARGALTSARTSGLKNLKYETVGFRLAFDA